MLRRVRDGRHSSRNCRPQRHCRGSSAQAEQQRRVLLPEPLEDLQRRVRVRPRLGVRRRDLAAVGERRLQRRARLAVDDRDLVPVLREVPRGGDADDARRRGRCTRHQAGVAARPRVASVVRPPPECSCRTGCGRRRRCRRARPAASTSRACCAAVGIRRERARIRDASTRRRTTAAAVCGACFSGLSARSRSPSSIARISRADRDHRVDEAVELVPSTRSRSARPSACPATGKLIVGAWKP